MLSFSAAVVRWSTRRSRRRCSWCGTYRRTSWRSLPNQWLLRPPRISPHRLFLFLQDMTYTSRKPAKTRILGLDVSSARNSMRRTRAKRWVKAGRRTRRCAKFGKWTSKQASARLWRTGAWAQKAYGTAAVGAPPTWIKQARTRAAEAAQCGGRGRCQTTAIALLHPNADPAVQIPCNLIRQWLIFWREHNHRIRPKIGKVWAKIPTAMVARSPATRWRYVRGHTSFVIVTLMQHNWTPIRHTSWKDPEGNPFERRSRGNCGGRLQGMSWAQAWRAGQISPRCSSMTNSWKERAYMQPEACSWLRQRRRAGHMRNGIVQGWWSRTTVSCRAGGVADLPEMRGRGRGYAPSSLAMPCRRR